jgi:hypothetical protein
MGDNEYSGLKGDSEAPVGASALQERAAYPASLKPSQTMLNVSLFVIKKLDKKGRESRGVLHVQF